MNLELPTKISDKGKEEFKELYLKKYNSLLSDIQIENEGLKLLRLIILIFENLDEEDI